MLIDARTDLLVAMTKGYCANRTILEKRERVKVDVSLTKHWLVK